MSEGEQSVGANIQLKSVSQVTYIGDSGERRRRYWDGDELVDEEVTLDGV